MLPFDYTFGSGGGGAHPLIHLDVSRVWILYAVMIANGVFQGAQTPV